MFTYAKMYARLQIALMLNLVQYIKVASDAADQMMFDRDLVKYMDTLHRALRSYDTEAFDYLLAISVRINEVILKMLKSLDKNLPVFIEGFEQGHNMMKSLNK